MACQTDMHTYSALRHLEERQGIDHDGIRSLLMEANIPNQSVRVHLHRTHGKEPDDRITKGKDEEALKQVGGY